MGDDLERLARRLVEVAKTVYATGIVYRGIKSINVMVLAAGPVLVDLGITMDEDGSHAAHTDLVMSTPGFVAPEIINGAESGDITDRWSVASVLAFTATGASVLGTKSATVVLKRETSNSADLFGLSVGTLAVFRSVLDPDCRNRCTPGQLLSIIASGTLNPNAWQDEQAGSFAAGTVAGQPTVIVTETAEAMPPFDMVDDVDRNNPRTI